MYNTNYIENLSHKQSGSNITKIYIDSYFCTSPHFIRFRTIGAPKLASEHGPQCMHTNLSTTRCDVTRIRACIQIPLPETLPGCHFSNSLLFVSWKSVHRNPISQQVRHWFVCPMRLGVWGEEGDWLKSGGVQWGNGEAPLLAHPSAKSTLAAHATILRISFFLF